MIGCGPAHAEDNVAASLLALDHGNVVAMRRHVERLDAVQLNDAVGNHEQLLLFLLHACMVQVADTYFLALTLKEGSARTSVVLVMATMQGDGLPRRVSLTASASNSDAPLAASNV